MNYAELIEKIPEEEKPEILRLLRQLDDAKRRESAQINFMDFVKEVWPSFIMGRHHKIMADAFERVARGELKRLIINLPPRHSKSELSSYLFPAWFLGKYPEKKIIQASHTAELSVNFGRKVRNLVGSNEYQKIFPNVGLQADSKAAGRWATNKGGEYFAIGVGGAIAGKGADCVSFSSKCMTKRGIVEIADVCVGDEVLGYDHKNGTAHWTSVKAISTQRKPKLINVGGVNCTPDHRIFTRSGYRKAEDAPDFAVLPMWEELSSLQERSRKEQKALRRGREVLLFESLPEQRRASKLSMWGEEGSPCEDLQEVPVVSWPISSCVLGACARDFEWLLHGEGYWVVDIQTGTENFFCEGVLVHNCLIIDDPHNEQEAITGQYDMSVYDKVYEWFSSGPRQRLQPGGAIVVVMTRWSKRDLTGQIVDSSIKKEGSSEWEVIELPAIMPSGDPLWPEFWSIDELQKLKVELPISKWSAQYQQDPTSEEGALIKRDWWNVWEGEKPPQCSAVIVAMDTAFSKTERSDYSACVCFGVFDHPNATGKPIPNLILLDAWKDKMEFPELKAATVQYYKDWQPDMFIIEKKASGAPLIAELRNAGVPVQEFTPTRATGDKIVRVNAITDIFASGVVWAPDEQFAIDVVEECAAFPSGDHDDYVDAVTMALMRFRQGGFIIPTDEDDMIELPKLRKEPFY